MGVLIDTDLGMGTLGCDPEDSFAITLALVSPEATVRAITCVQGNVPVRWLAERDVFDRVLAVAQPPYAEPRAVELISRTARESDGLTIIAIGPLTNVAAAIVPDPRPGRAS
jgi:inosine-uridine nucleoside N-ribohydrolase